MKRAQRRRELAQQEEDARKDDTKRDDRTREKSDTRVKDTDHVTAIDSASERKTNRWILEGSRDRCIVLVENDPSPGAGRISFMNKGASDDQNNDVETQENVSVTDAEMAATLNKARPKKSNIETLERKHRNHDQDKNGREQKDTFKRPPDSIEIGGKHRKKTKRR